MTETVLSVKNLQKVYNQQTVFDHLSFDVQRGERVFVTGENGAGKSTLIEILLGINSATSGEISFFGREPQHIGNEVYSKIYFLSHETFFYFSLTAYENLEFALNLFLLSRSNSKKIKSSRKKEIIEKSLKNVSLFFDRNKKIDQLSYGMRHRLSIARFYIWDQVTSVNPSGNLSKSTSEEERIIFMDEPYSGLDRNGVEIFDCLIKEKSQSGLTIVEATHRLKNVEEIWKSSLTSAKSKKKKTSAYIKVLIMKKGSMMVDSSKEKITKELSKYW